MARAWWVHVREHVAPPEGAAAITSRPYVALRAGCPKWMNAPCADVFELVDGKIKRFDCYLSGTVVLTQQSDSATS